MRRIGLWVGGLLCAWLGGCGGPEGPAAASVAGASGGIVGTWALDLERTMQDGLSVHREQLQAVLQKAKADLEAADAKLSALPAAEVEGKRAELRKRIVSGAGRHADLVEAFLRSPGEAEALLVTKALERAQEQFKGTSVGMVFRADQTYVGRTVREGEVETESGTWTFADGKLTTLWTHRNGIREGRKAEPKEVPAQVTGDVLVLRMGDGKLGLHFQRSSVPLDERPDPAVVDPTPLLSSEEVAAATGVAVGAPEGSGKGRAVFRTTATPSEEVVRLSVERRRPDAAERFARSRHDRALVPGLGDEAYADVDYVCARQGQVEFRVEALQPVPRGKRREVAESLAKLVAARLK